MEFVSDCSSSQPRLPLIKDFPDTVIHLVVKRFHNKILTFFWLKEWYNVYND